MYLWLWVCVCIYVPCVYIRLWMCSVSVWRFYRGILCVCVSVTVYIGVSGGYSPLGLGKLEVYTHKYIHGLIQKYRCMQT